MPVRPISCDYLLNLGSPENASGIQSITVPMSDPMPALPRPTAEFYRPMPLYLTPRPKQRYWLHGILLLWTVFTTLVVGSHMQRNFGQGLSPPRRRR